MLEERGVQGGRVEAQMGVLRARVAELTDERLVGPAVRCGPEEVLGAGT